MEKFNLKINENKLSLLIDDVEVGYMYFDIDTNSLNVTKTVVYENYQHKGYAKRMMNYIIKYCEDNNLEFTYTCSFINNSIKK